MTFSSADQVHYAILAVVLFVQGCLLLRAFLISRNLEAAQFEKARERFAEDLKDRASRGESPDWLYYRGELDQFFEGRNDRLRSLAAAALAAGIGGTILSLIISIQLFGFDQSKSDPQNNIPAGIEQPEEGMPAIPSSDSPGSGSVESSVDLILGMGTALGGSLTGVLNNLLIVLLLIPLATSRAEKQVQCALEGLLDLSRRHRPREMFSQAIRDEIAALRQSINQELTTAFSRAMSDFPSVVGQLGVQVNALTGIVERQGESMGRAVADLIHCAQQVATSSANLQPAADQMARATQVLASVPGQLKDTLSRSHEAWITSARSMANQLAEIQKHAEEKAIAREMRMVQAAEAREKAALEAAEAREKAMLEASKELQGSFADIQKTVSQIPGHLRQEIKNIANTLGNEFGLEAKAHINDLEQILLRQNQQLQDRIGNHEQEWRNNISNVVQELLNGVSDQVKTNIVQPLERSHAGFEALATELPSITYQIKDAHQRWIAASNESLQSWEGAAVRIGESAHSLAAAAEPLEQARQSLVRSAQELEKARQSSTELEHRLGEILGRLSQQHLEDLAPLRHDLVRALSGIQQDHAALNQLFDHQASFIKTCIELILKARRPGIASP